jgi:predicted PurR-regulated permease PerM
VAVLLPSSPPQLQGSRSLSTFVIATASGIALLYFGRIFLITLVISIILAFILEPVVVFFMRFRMPRAFASFLACSIAVLVMYLAGLGLYTQALGLAGDLPAYSMRLNQVIDNVAVALEKTENSVYDVLIPRRIREREKQIQQALQQAQAQQARQVQARRNQRRVPEPPPIIAAEPPVAEPPVQEVRIRPERSPLVNYLYTSWSSLYTILLMASFVPFLVYFMLSWRDHIRRAFLQLFEGQARTVASKTWEGIANMARAYVVGNFLLGVLLSIASAALFFLMKLPYWQLIGPVSGFLSLVPYVGLPLALIPPLLVAVTVYNTLAPYLILASLVAFFHLLALNLLYPMIVGGKVHLNPLVVTIALMFWGTIWGGIGLVLAIPITAGIKAICDNVTDLQPFGKLLGD